MAAFRPIRHAIRAFCSAVQFSDGCSIESMSYRYGGFHDTCLEYEVVTARGDVLTCRPDNEHALVFQMVHGGPTTGAPMPTN